MASPQPLIGAVRLPSLQEMFWGDDFAALRDAFGVQWMVNCSEKAK